MSTIFDYCKDLPTVTLNEGDILLKEGDKSNKFYILIDGECEILRGDFRINKVSEPGSMLGEMSILLNNPHMATVKSTKTTELYVVNDATDFLKSNTDITFHLAKALALRLNGVTSYLMDIKAQFEGSKDHFGMVDEVLESLIYDQDDEHVELGSERDKSSN
jgi:CRP-like cAMP-binding protein